MGLKKWDNLSEKMRNPLVRPYYEALIKRKGSLRIKRIFDIGTSVILIIILSPVLGGVALWIKLDSSGPVLFKQTRITQYGKSFSIYKFRTMVKNAEALGSQVTIKNDMRITRIGRVLRKYRLDELPQLFNILKGEMSFVGTRPEVPKYVKHYDDEMWATLLMPAGVTSEASISFKDEELLLNDAENVDQVYIDEILPRKMRCNLDALKNFSFPGDIRLMLRTVVEVMK